MIKTEPNKINKSNWETVMHGVNWQDETKRVYNAGYEAWVNMLISLRVFQYETETKLISQLTKTTCASCYKDKSKTDLFFWKMETRFENKI